MAIEKFRKCIHCGDRRVPITEKYCPSCGKELPPLEDHDVDHEEVVFKEQPGGEKKEPTPDVPKKEPAISPNKEREKEENSHSEVTSSGRSDDNSWIRYLPDKVDWVNHLSANKEVLDNILGRLS